MGIIESRQILGVNHMITKNGIIIFDTLILIKNIQTGYFVAPEEESKF